MREKEKREEKNEERREMDLKSLGTEFEVGECLDGNCTCEPDLEGCCWSVYPRSCLHGSHDGKLKNKRSSED